jgi:hypothetical protein
VVGSDSARQSAAASTRFQDSSNKTISRAEIWFLVAVCTLAAGRILYGAAALPFFADTDENAHFDLIHKFYRGEWPATNHTLHDKETVKVWIFDGSPEYLNAPGTLGVKNGFPPPVRAWAPTAATENYIRSQWESPGRGKLPNHEAHEPPVYYSIAAIWYACGQALGLSPASSIYWVRFLNAPLFVGLVITAFLFSRRYLDAKIAWCVTTLTALFPNVIYFTINADVLSPLVVLITLYLLFRWYEADHPGIGLAAACGLMAAVSILAKLTNTAVLVPTAAIVFLRLRHERNWRTALAQAGPLILCAALPPFLWALRNRLVLGDWSGSAEKILAQTWTPKPWSEIFDHPLFTLTGPMRFLRALFISFFAGDSHWHGSPVDFLPGQYFFLGTTAVLPIVALIGTFRDRRNRPLPCLVAGISALLVCSYLAELSVLSLRWDFGINPYPSREFPFFAFGRLIGGAIVPLLALEVLAIAFLTRNRVLWMAIGVAVIGGMMILSQAVFLQMTISSQFNWFHLP